MSASKVLNCVPCIFFTLGNKTGCLQLHHLKRGLLCGDASKPRWYKMVKDKRGPPRQHPDVCLFTFNRISHWSPEMGIVNKRISLTGKYAEKRKAKLSAKILFSSPNSPWVIYDDSRCSEWVHVFSSGCEQRFSFPVPFDIFPVSG